jgi:hypothetical protein
MALAAGMLCKGHVLRKEQHIHAGMQCDALVPDNTSIVAYSLYYRLLQLLLVMPCKASRASPATFDGCFSAANSR